MHKMFKKIGNEKLRSGQLGLLKFEFEEVYYGYRFSRR